MTQLDNVDLESLIQSVDIVEYISQFVDLEEKNGEFWGLSCFKDEKTPSFSVRRDPPVFYDYSSGIGGNVFTFVRYYFHCSPAEAVKKLVSYVGFSPSSFIPSAKLSILETIKRYRPPSHTQRPPSGTVLPDDVMLRYEKRPEKIKTWLDEGISQRSLDKYQVYYDAFSNRLVYPIRNLEGKIVNVGGRTLDTDWKERGQRKYCYFYSWGTLDVLYGLYENLDSILERREVIIFEGCKSVLLADTFGVPNTCAALTSHLNPNQMKILAKLGCTAVFAFDNDVDVRKDHNIAKLSHYVNVEWIHDRFGLLDEKDSPVDRGKEVFEKLYAAKIRLKL